MWSLPGAFSRCAAAAPEAIAIEWRSGSAVLADLRFVDVTAPAGIDFEHVKGASGQKYFPETMGMGVGFFDCDGDQDLDIYLVNGAAFPGCELALEPANALYRNDGDGRFTEVSAAAGVDDGGYGMGCAAADYDSDGDLDLYLTNFGPNVLYRNEGNGRFIEVTSRAGVGDSTWSTGSAFFDYDNDGDLDLYVANYVQYDLASAADDLTPYLQAPQDYAGTDIKAYPHPRNFPGAADVLFRNEGDGLFVDVSALAGLVDTVMTEGRGLGVVATDYNDDGYVDLYVANDAVRNFLYRNDRDGSFSEIGAVAGVAYGQDGQREASMGVDVSDYDHDGDMDIVVNNFEKEPTALYQNRGDDFFAHASFASGIGLVSLRPLSFGAGFADYDNDGYQDLFIANGHVLDNIALFDQSTTYEQPNLWLRNQGPDKWGRYRFEDVSSRVGAGMLSTGASRGCAFGDYDDDGDVDILVGNCGQRPTLLRNDGGNANHWLTIKTVGVRSNRDGIGARIVVRAGDLSQVREVRGSYSYLSQSDLRVSFGLGRRTRVDEVEISWPGGEVERLQDVAVDQFLTIVEGRGIAETRDPGNPAPMSNDRGAR